MLGKHAVLFGVLKLQHAFRWRRINLRIWNFHYVGKCSLQLMLFIPPVLLIKEYTSIWNCPNFAILNFFLKVVCPCEGSQSTCGYSTENDFGCFWVKSKVFLKLFKSFNCDIVPSKIKRPILVHHRLFLCSLMSWTITIVQNDFFPIPKVIVRVFGKYVAVCWWYRLSIRVWTAQVCERSGIAVL